MCTEEILPQLFEMRETALLNILEHEDEDELKYQYWEGYRQALCDLVFWMERNDDDESYSE